MHFIPFPLFLQLVNDLDLSVVDPQNTTHLGNSMYPGIAVPDRSNNVEKVWIPSGFPVGFYSVQVTAYRVVVDAPQDFALVVSYGSTIALSRVSIFSLSFSL